MGILSWFNRGAAHRESARAESERLDKLVADTAQAVRRESASVCDLARELTCEIPRLPPLPFDDPNRIIEPEAPGIRGIGGETYGRTRAELEAEFEALEEHARAKEACEQDARERFQRKMRERREREARGE